MQRTFLFFDDKNILSRTKVKRELGKPKKSPFTKTKMPRLLRVCPRFGLTIKTEFTICSITDMLKEDFCLWRR